MAEETIAKEKEQISKEAENQTSSDAKTTSETPATAPSAPPPLIDTSAPLAAESEPATPAQPAPSAPSNSNPEPSKSAVHKAVDSSAVPPPPVLKPLPAQPRTSAPSAPPVAKANKNKKFPSIAPASAPQSTVIVASPQPLIGENDTGKRLTPSGGYYIECFLREVITNIRRNPMMSVASISTVMVLALILGLFTLVVINLDNLAHELANEMQIKVYMASTFPDEEAETCRQRILKIEHVTGAKFIPKDEAFKRLRERLDTQISLEDLEQNPLPDAFQVPVDDAKYLEQVAQQLHEITAIDKVDYGREEASKLLALNKAVRLVGFIILLLLFGSTVLIVSNTIRLTVFARRKEIDIMQLVGAADWFIRWPFILEGVAQGLIGAGLSALALDLGYRLVVPHFQRSIAFIPIIPPNHIMPYLCLGLALMGCVVGAIGSLISVNRYLKA